MYKDRQQELYLALAEEMDLQKVQDYFCKLANLFVYAVDSRGGRLTEVSGKTDEAERLLDAIGPVAFHDLAHRVMESPLEDQLVEDTEYANVKVAAVAVKKEGRPIMCWLACCVLNEEDIIDSGRCFRGCSTTTDRLPFYRALDMLGVMAGQILSVWEKFENVRTESVRSRHSATELTRALKRTEAMTNVVQMLTNEGSFEELAGRIMEIVGRFLGVTGVQLLQVARDGNTLDVAVEWGAECCPVFYEKTHGLERTDFFESDKSSVVSKDTMVSGAMRMFMSEHQLKAFMVYPILVQKEVAMYLTVTEQKLEKIWQIDEVKFVSDVVKVLQSMLLKRIQKNSLASSYVSLQAILDNVGACIYVRDVENKKVLFANRLLKKTFEWEISRNTLDDLLDRARPLGVREGYYEVHHAQRKRWYDMYYTFITWVDGSKVSLCALYDVTDKKLYQKKIEQQAYTDFLTGLYNRMCCERDLAGQIDKAKLTGGKGSLLYMDLDDFKNINDGLGHQYGDVLLKSISQSLRQIEGIYNGCYRMGGDEFVIIIPPESFAKFDEIIDRIKDVFCKPWFLKDADYYCTMSMGICTFPDQGDDVQDLIKKADIAMYEAKKTGKNRVSFYSGEIEEETAYRFDMEKNMRHASKDNCNEFEVFFQPVIDIRKPGKPCIGAEALLRWNSSSMGFIPPSDFIPLAEYLGLINPIGNHVLRQACEACREWNERGGRELRVSVNLSVVQLLQNDIVEQISATIQDTGIDPRRLTLEVTESLAINDLERMKKILRSIRKLGVKIALDDFGTGYSSLNHIREIPLDVIKVDQSFVTELTEDEYSQSFIKMVSELAEAINVGICVEGVETEEQCSVLEGMKVRMVQGYYFDRPMQRDEFERKYVR